MPTANTTKRSKSYPNRRQGQSVIEFAVVSMVFVAMLFLSYNAVMAFAFQQYVAHAVFMSARVFQASQETPQTQETRAKIALNNYLPGLDGGQIRLGNSSIRANVISVDVPTALDVPTGSGKPTDSSTAIRVVFEMPLAALPLGDGDWNAIKKIRLEASSFLGREPTEVECYGYFDQLLKALIIPGAPSYHQRAMEDSKTSHALTDNGC